MGMDGIGQFHVAWIFIGLICLVLWILKAILCSPKRVGLSGEGRVARRLERLPRDIYRVVNDVMLPTIDGNTTQVDHVVVSRYGIFVIEPASH